ncbi:MAG: hypothetical protein AB2792_13415 [Candidatus Thiodiazotropha sp.]
MITKKITKDMEEKLLKIIFERYTEEYGYGTRNLSDYKIIITGGSMFEDEMPEIVELDPDQRTKRYLLVDIFKELMARGYIECSEDNAYYWLSENGYNYASKTKLQHFISYLNNNAGWAIPLALLSLLVSIFALFVG